MLWSVQWGMFLKEGVVLVGGEVKGEDMSGVSVRFPSDRKAAGVFILIKGFWLYNSMSGLLFFHHSPQNIVLFLFAGN